MLAQMLGRTLALCSNFPKYCTLRSCSIDRTCFVSRPLEHSNLPLLSCSSFFTVGYQNISVLSSPFQNSSELFHEMFFCSITRNPYIRMGPKNNVALQYESLLCHHNKGSDRSLLDELCLALLTPSPPDTSLEVILE